MWKIGNIKSTVVTDEKPESGYYEISDEAFKYYGGYLIAESIPTGKTAQLISAAPEMLYALKVAIGQIEHAPEPFSKEEKVKVIKMAIELAEGAGN